MTLCTWRKKAAFNALRTFEGHTVHVGKDWNIFVVNNVYVKRGKDVDLGITRAMTLGQRVIWNIQQEAEASWPAAGRVRIGHSNSSSAESVSRASSTTVSKGDVTSVSGNTQQHIKYNPDQYIENRINKCCWCITSHALLCGDGRTVQVGADGRVFVENQSNRNSDATCRAKARAVDIGRRVVERITPRASGPAGGVRRDHRELLRLNLFQEHPQLLFQGGMLLIFIFYLTMCHGVRRGCDGVNE